MNILDAEQIATAFLGAPPEGSSYSFTILDENTIDRPSCFVFFYDSSRYIETNNFEDRLAGNAPILVDKINGEPRFLGTTEPVQFYIEQFESERD